jgi:N-ethylmaleimide reductase
MGGSMLPASGQMLKNRAGKLSRRLSIAAKRAISAGFDGVELHGANGYLVDEFIRDGSNKRTDEYGGSTDNRLRFLVEVTKALADAVGADKVGVRLSPKGQYNDMQDSNPIATFTRAAELVNPLGLAYLHVMEALPGHMMYAEGERVLPHIRKVYKGIIVTNGGYTKTSGNMALENREADAITFGMLYLANPDLVSRFKIDGPYNNPDFSSLYTPGEKGYIDYPVLNQ